MFLSSFCCIISTFGLWVVGQELISDNFNVPLIMQCIWVKVDISKFLKVFSLKSSWTKWLGESCCNSTLLRDLMSFTLKGCFTHHPSLFYYPQSGYINQCWHMTGTVMLALKWNYNVMAVMSCCWMVDSGVTQWGFIFPARLICSCEISNGKGSAGRSEPLHGPICMHSDSHFPRESLIHHFAFWIPVLVLPLSILPLGLHAPRSHCRISTLAPAHSDYKSMGSSISEWEQWGRGTADRGAEEDMIWD